MTPAGIAMKWLRGQARTPRQRGREPQTAPKTYRRPNEDIQAMLRAFKASSVLRPPD
jgi:hypothetical protein